MDDGRVLASPTLSWTQQSGPPGVLFSQPASASTGATLPGVGVFELRLTAFDGQLSGSDVVRITVAPELPPSLDAADATVVEGNEGQTGASVEVRLSKPWAAPVSVDYVTRDATAANPCDYRRRFGTLEFAAGETSRSVLVPVVGDHASEGNEALDFLIGNPVGAILGRDHAVVSVTDDDAANRAPVGAPAAEPCQRQRRRLVASDALVVHERSRFGRSADARRLPRHRVLPERPAVADGVSRGR